MAKKFRTRKYKNEDKLNAYFKEIKEEIMKDETEHTWSKFVIRLNQLNKLCAVCHNLPSFLEEIKEHKEFLSNSLLSIRAPVALAAMCFVVNLAKASGINFKPYLELIMVPLLDVTKKRRNKLVRNAVFALKTIITCTKLHEIVPYLSPYLSSEDSQVRNRSRHILLKCLETMDPIELNNYIDIYISAIKIGVIDNEKETRALSRSMYKSFKRLYPSSVPDLIAALCNDAKWSLGIPIKPDLPEPQNPNTNAPIPSHAVAAPTNMPTNIPTNMPTNIPTNIEIQPNINNHMQSLRTPTTLPAPPISSEYTSNLLDLLQPSAVPARQAYPGNFPIASYNVATPNSQMFPSNIPNFFTPIALPFAPGYLRTTPGFRYTQNLPTPIRLHNVPNMFIPMARPNPPAPTTNRMVLDINELEEVEKLIDFDLWKQN